MTVTPSKIVSYTTCPVSPNASISHQQSHDEATSAVVHCRAACIAAVTARDLPHQRQTQAGSGALAGIVGAIERPEHIFQLRLRNAGAAIPHGDRGVAGIARNAYLGGCCAMAAGVFQQVSQQTAQQAGVAADAD